MLTLGLLCGGLLLGFAGGRVSSRVAPSSCAAMRFDGSSYRCDAVPDPWCVARQCRLHCRQYCSGRCDRLNGTG